MRPHVRVLAALSLALAALPVASAAAGPVVQIGAGRQPSAAMEPASGRLHAVWTDQTASRSVHYCRFPRGATACDKKADLVLAATDPPPGEVLGPAFIVRDAAAGTLYITSDATSGEYVWTSADAGESWAAPVRISGATNGSPTTLPVLGPAAGSITVAAENTKTVFSAPLAPGTGTTFATLAGGGDADFAINLTPDGGLVGVAASLSSSFAWRMAAGADPSLPASWAFAPLATGEVAPRLATGPSGTFVVTQASDAPYDVRLRRWSSGLTFGAAKAVGRGETAAQPAIAVGPSGQVTAVWRLNTPGANALRAATSTDGGATFGAPYTFAAQQNGELYPSVALAQDGKGRAVWQGGPNDYTIRTATLDPAGAGDTTSSGTPRQVKSDVPGASIAFGVPRSCVQPGGRFRVTLSWKRKKRKGNLFVKINRADFYIGAKVAKTDRTPPFVQTLTVTATAAPGSKITLRARAFIKVRHGKVPKKSIRAVIKVCPSS